MCELLERMKREMFSNSPSAKEVVPQIDAVILLDRNIDLVTPLSTQLTYEGLIDEIYCIRHGGHHIELGVVKQPPSLFQLPTNLHIFIIYTLLF